ncbi:MAG: aldo/keto reductase [Gammaproteobacteria bacterium]|nr:aldo/keto reductase [Gammaproteobacteria bacterium]
MEFRTLGHSGLRISTVGLGCMNFGLMCDQSTTDAIVDTAIDAGVNFFDVADIYGGPQHKSETMLGKALGARRASVIVATKFGAKLGGRGGAAEGGGSRAYILQAVEQSLTRLGTDYIDLYQHHFPDTGTPVEETLRALQDLVVQGKVRHIGCSNYSADQLQAATVAAREAGTSAFASAQNRYSLLHREIEAALVPVAQGHQVGILPYFPLESGLLSGKYREGEKPPADTRFGKWGGGGGFVSPARWRIVGELHRYADSIGRSVLDLAIGWLAAQPFVSSVIAGVTRPEQVRQNVAAAGWPISADQVDAIAKIAAAS